MNRLVPPPRTPRVQAVVLDWAGTAVDHGCCAPVGVFCAVFAAEGVPVSIAEARAPMGTHKREHIVRMCAAVPLRARWESVRGAPPTDADIDRMYAALEPLALDAIALHADPVPELLEVVASLRARGLRIASTTGYNRRMLDVLEAAAAERGYRPDVAIASSEVREGRPSPYMIWEALSRLGLHDVARCVKVGDTAVDVAEGRNGGLWTVAVVARGNEVGLSLAEWDSLAPAEAAARLEHARTVLAAAGPHYLIDTLAELPAVLVDIESRLAAGETP